MIEQSNQERNIRKQSSFSSNVIIVIVIVEIYITSVRSLFHLIGWVYVSKLTSGEWCNEWVPVHAINLHINNINACFESGELLNTD